MCKTIGCKGDVQAKNCGKTTAAEVQAMCRRAGEGSWKCRPGLDHRNLSQAFLKNVDFIPCDSNNFKK